MPLVEEGWTEHPVTEQVARIYLAEARAGGDGADVLVLACTHYPLIAPLLRRTAPEKMAIVDSAESTARVVNELVESMNPTLLAGGADKGEAPATPLKVEASAFMRADQATLNDPRFSVRPLSKPSDHRSFQFFVTDSVDKFKKLATRFLGRQVDRVEHVDLGG